MAIVKLKKLTFCGLINEKSKILQQLQALGGTHLICLNKLPFSTEQVTHQQTEKAISALKYLNQCAKKRHQVSEMEGFDLDKTVNEVLQLHTQIQQLANDYDFLAERISEVEPWGDFVLPESDAALGGIKLWFYILPKRLMSKIKDPDLIWQVVYQDNINCYLVVLAEHEPPAARLPVPRTHTGSVRLSELKKQYEQTALDLEDLKAKRECLTRWISLIGLSLAANEDRAELKTAHALTLDGENLFVLQAWGVSSELKKYQHFANQHKLALMVEIPDISETPPTLLNNPEQFAAGEDVISFYQIPNYHSWDPSAIVFFSFALFFAMILSDAGYAALLAVILAIKWKKLGAARKGQRFRMLAASMLSVSVLWGILAGSYFGYTPPEGSLVAFVKILDLNDFDNMMRLSITVGVAHIALANLVMAYQRRGSLLAIASLGWTALVIGGFTLWCSLDLQLLWLKYSAYGLFGIGGLCLLLFNSEREVKTLSDWMWRLFDGLKGLTGITQLFGDVLSYMRLFALGLASSSLALTFNQLAVQIYQEVSGLGLLFAILILIIGHSLNLVLCLMSGVVHGLRLNFIEFYNWSVSDEGYPFKAFSKKGV
ncbi:MAG: ATPase [Methylococcaceae bacterium]|nr:ATPase [Methylococcaceae bacterium]